MKRELFVIGAIIFSMNHGTVGKVVNEENPTIQNKLGENLPVDLTECREATEEESKLWNDETAENTEASQEVVAETQEG